MPATITEPPYFRFWQEPTMDNQAVTLSFSRDLSETNTSKKGVVYFGSPLEIVKLQTTVNAGVDNVLISPALTLTAPERNTAYTIGGCNDFIVNGYVFRLKTGGTTAAQMPPYSTNLGDLINDGTAQFQCVSKAHSVNELRLSLSEDGLQSAQWGQPLSLGNTVMGGSEIAVYYEFLDGVDNPFNSAGCEQLCISINECTESLI